MTGSNPYDMKFNPRQIQNNAQKFQYRGSGLGNMNNTLNAIRGRQENGRMNEYYMGLGDVNAIVPEERTDSGVSRGSYLDKLADVESGGNYTAYNKGSGAYGKYQFIPSTEKFVAGKLGISIDEARTPSGQEKMIDYFTEQNRKGLKRAGYKATDTNLWYAHNLGLFGARTLLSGGQVNPLHISSNAGKSQEDYKNKWSKIF